MMSADGSAAIEDEAYSKDRSPILRSHVKEQLTSQAKVHAYLSWAIMGSKLFRPSKKRLREISDMIVRGDDWLDDYLDSRLLIFPVYHTAAPQHGQVFKEIFSIRKTFLKYMPYIAYANVWGLPALTLPVGKDDDGMPISIQIISASGNEPAIFRLGSIIEKKFRGYNRCRRLD
jgi:Asp-tRNA(Asn)/Glu-tRNA(Gln) amidotransferase A subunit family amidase